MKLQEKYIRNLLIVDLMKTTGLSRKNADLALKELEEFELVQFGDKRGFSLCVGQKGI